MPGRATRVTSRIVFAICGLVSLLTGAVYVLLRGEDMPFQSEWVAFAIALGVVGVLSLTLAVLPRSWIAKASKKDRDDPKLFPTLLKLLGIFAVTFYLLAVIVYLAPRRWNPDPQLMLILCPMYLVKMSFDPPLTTVFFLLAPMNAAVFGSLGLTLAFARSALLKRNSG